MTQTDLNVTNASGAIVRADINAHLNALVSLSSGATAPATTFPNQTWFDTSTNILKQRDNANTAWINIALKAGAVWIPYRDGTLLGDAAEKTVGTSGDTIPKNDTSNVFGPAIQIFTESGVDIAPAQSRNTLNTAAAKRLRYLFQGTDTIDTVKNVGGIDFVSESNGNWINSIGTLSGRQADGVVDVLQWGAGVFTPGASGGDKGADTFNAQNYFLGGVEFPITKRFESAEQTYTLGTKITLAHGLGGMPKSFGSFMVCKVAEGNYNVDDRMEMNWGFRLSASVPNGITASADTTNLFLTVTNSPPFIMNKNTGALFGMAITRWKIIGVAIA